MPQDFLRQLANMALPQVFHDEASIDKIRVLVAAELVEAELPHPGAVGPATVTCLTTMGRVTALPRPGLKGSTVASR